MEGKDEIIHLSSSKMFAEHRVDGHMAPAQTTLSQGHSHTVLANIFCNRLQKEQQTTKKNPSVCNDNLGLGLSVSLSVFDIYHAKGNRMLL